MTENLGDKVKVSQVNKLLQQTDDFIPAIPDEVLHFFLKRSGFIATDHRVEKALSLAVQKFIHDIGTDALFHSKLRDNKGNTNFKKSNNPITLTVDDLSISLSENGIDIEKPKYYANNRLSGVDMRSLR